MSPHEREEECGMAGKYPTNWEWSNPDPWSQSDSTMAGIPSLVRLTR
jgi:hypothetical protein